MGGQRHLQPRGGADLSPEPRERRIWLEHGGADSSPSFGQPSSPRATVAIQDDIGVLLKDTEEHCLDLAEQARIMPALILRSAGLMHQLCQKLQTQEKELAALRLACATKGNRQLARRAASCPVPKSRIPLGDPVSNDLRVPGGAHAAGRSPPHGPGAAATGLFPRAAPAKHFNAAPQWGPRMPAEVPVEVQEKKLEEAPAARLPSKVALAEAPADTAAEESETPADISAPAAQLPEANVALAEVPADTTAEESEAPADISAAKAEAPADATAEESEAPADISAAKAEAPKEAHREKWWMWWRSAAQPAQPPADAAAAGACGDAPEPAEVPAGVQADPAGGPAAADAPGSIPELGEVPKEVQQVMASGGATAYVTLAEMPAKVQVQAPVEVQKEAPKLEERMTSMTACSEDADIPSSAGSLARMDTAETMQVQRSESWGSDKQKPLSSEEKGCCEPAHKDAAASVPFPASAVFENFQTMFWIMSEENYGA